LRAGAGGAPGVTATTRRASANPLRLGSVRAGCVRWRMGRNGSARPRVPPPAPRAMRCWSEGNSAPVSI